MPDEVASDNRAGAADTTPAVNVHAVPGIQQAVNFVQQSRHEGTCGDAEITNRPPRPRDIRLADAAHLAQDRLVRLKLVRFCEIDEAIYACCQEGREPAGRILCTPCAGILPREQTQRLNPIGVGNRRSWRGVHRARIPQPFRANDQAELDGLGG